jgi:hypothetical protein
LPKQLVWVQEWPSFPNSELQFAFRLLESPEEQLQLVSPVQIVELDSEAIQVVQE